MILWGLLFPTVKLGYKIFGISSVNDILTFAGFRFLICGLIICIFVLLRSPNAYKALKTHWHMVLLAGVFAIILHYSFTYIGLSMTEGSKTAILKQLGAVFYICFSAMFFPNDKLTVRKIVGLVLGVCGILVINADTTGITFHMGDILVIGASFCTVFSNVISKKVFRYVEPIVATGVSQLFGGVVLLCAGLFFGGNVTNVIPQTKNEVAVFAVIITASVISYCLWFAIVHKEKLSKLFVIKFTEPLFAAVFGWFILGENIWNIRYLLAFAFISAGIIVSNKE
jgi:drug/metabolite transporter (DMT)-like permease